MSRNPEKGRPSFSFWALVSNIEKKEKKQFELNFLKVLVQILQIMAYSTRLGLVFEKK
jgi:hypothetical protein